MNDTERTEEAALPLAEAAARLGISPDALRMRMRRGKARGFKRDGHLYVYLSEQPSEQGRANGISGARARTQGAAGARPDPNLPVVVEFQQVELRRVLRENERLNQRLDQMMEELRHLREMQQREQVLRQQDLGLRQQLQALLDVLAARPVLSAPEPERKAEPEPEQQAEPEPAFRPEAAREPEPDTSAWAPPKAPSAPAGGTRPAEPADHTEELADILRGVGDSLHDLERPTRPAGTVPPGPAEPADRRPPEPVAPRAAAPEPDRPAVDVSDDEQARLVEILGRMGPSAEDRRNAARILKRLFRNRGAARTPRES